MTATVGLSAAGVEKDPVSLLRKERSVTPPWWQPVRRSEGEQHPGVAKCVGLDPFQVQKLGDALVVRPEQLRIYLRLDRLPVDGLEPVPREEGGLEREAEDPVDAQVAGVLQKLSQQRGAQSPPLELWPYGDRAHLGEVLPHDMEGAAADDLAGDLDDPELVNCLVV